MSDKSLWDIVKVEWRTTALVVNELVRHALVAGVAIVLLHVLAAIVEFSSRVTGTSVVGLPLVPGWHDFTIKQVPLTIDAVIIVLLAWEAFHDIRRLYQNARVQHPPA